MNSTVPRRTSTLAVLSLVFGILGWSVIPFLGSLVAIVTGHMARAEIRRDPQMDGDGLAVAGLVLGWLMVALAVLALFVLVVFFGGLAWLAHLHS
ncbi:DUF4190 domain-containing protein [Xanthomonas massiliensis]|jgi:hypothetical protein|uniref:DUF4190 domain-containing protein n=1 Tax=Xanthomonas massiliensis TaxID=1720302 RepID=UPI000826A688|nr:DUF4190 domain-containing protein [Xanthomonas massiliensis]